MGIVGTRGKPSINDSDINAFSQDQSLSIKATENKKDAYHEADFIIICVPTDFDEESSSFDTSILERVLNDAITTNSDALVIIRSTIPVGYSEQAREKYQTKNIIFCPEFLREHSAMHDVLNPSRIIVGDDSELSTDFAKLMSESTENKPEIILISAGFDAHTRDPLANINLESEDFYEITKKIVDLANIHSKGRIISFLEGGYDLLALSESINSLIF